ncbi:oligoendopeptidase F [Aneurinibacillus tyrosinisolvens]|uniref:oligoendopeptidase F n=1 Tax=Aneurinibacillus tyrosinisolvens TaxID=1443435 RepID=UPI00063F352C|nr:oligoendopeptidase F [Aneurinibacillus tyrosinisolvens]
MNSTIPQRNEIPEEYKWNLEAIYPDDSSWEQDFHKTEELSRKVSQFKGKLAESPQRLLECLNLDTEVSCLMEKVYVYAAMRKDQDTRDSKYQGLVQRAGSLSVKVNEATSFIVPGILQIPDETLENFYESEPELQFYKKYLNKILRKKGHILSAEQEELLARTGELASAPQTIFGMIDNADMKYGKVIVDGEEIELTKGRYAQLLENPEQEVRKKAFETLYESYSRQKNTIAATLNASIKKDVFYARTRKYPSALEASLLDDNIPVSVYTNLITTVKSRLDSMFEYLKLRKEMLGVEELHMYDIFAPLVSETKMEIPYKEAYETVKKGLAPLGEEYLAVLDEAYNSRWIDVYETEGKRSGAYSWGAYGTHPYVLLNHQDTLNDMFTLAHELGHSMHSYLSDKNQPYLYAQYTIFVAEVASTVNEALLMRYLLEHTDDKNTKMYLMTHFLNQFRSTLIRQTQFAEYEKITHEMVEKGESLTAEEFSAEYLKLNREYYGEGIIHDEEIALEWSRIPHFYNAFYVYKYATGFSAAIALSKAILEEGKPAVERYLEFLKSGGSDYPLELLKKAGVDMTTSKPIEDALDVFAQYVEELRKLHQEK